MLPLLSVNAVSIDSPRSVCYNIVWRQRATLPRLSKGNIIAATLPDATVEWVEGGRKIRAEIWNGRVQKDARPGSVFSA